MKGVRKYYLCEEDHIPSKHKGIITAYITSGSVAFSFCSPKDQFSRKRGQIALGRLLRSKTSPFVVSITNSEPASEAVDRSYIFYALGVIGDKAPKFVKKLDWQNLRMLK